MGRETARHRRAGDGPVPPDRDLHEQGAVRGPGLSPRLAPQQRIGTAATPPNILLLITDQQRYPCYWPEDPGWLRELTPNQHQLEETGLRFDRAFCNTSMCSPSRATLLTGRYPA